MKGLIVTKGGDVELVHDIPMPEIGPYDALVKTECCMICNGTDMELIRGELPEAQNFPAMLGHESAGRITEVGEKVAAYKQGDLVVRASLPDNEIYHSAWGGFAEYGIVRDSAAMTRDGLQPDPCGLTQQVVPEGITAQQASLMITLKETCSAVQRIGITADDTVLVVGDGPVGLCMVSNLTLLGVSTVLVLGNRHQSLEIARQLGAADTFWNHDDEARARLAAQYGHKISVYLDTVGSQDTIVQGMGLVAPEGKIAVYGLRSGDNLTLPVRGMRNFTLQFVQWPLEQREMVTHDLIAKAILDGAIETDRFISHVLPVEDFAEGFAAIREKRALKVALCF